MKFLVSLFSLILFSSAGYADNEFALLAGIRSNSAETDLNSASVSSRTGYQGGALLNLEYYPAWSLRTGILLASRQVSLGPTLQGQVELNFSYVDIPATFLYQFSSMGGIFAGPVLSFNQSKETSCSLTATCSARDVKSVIYPLQMGVQFRFASQMGAELYYEYVSGEIATNLSNMKTVGANFLLFFE
jgi:hypothetical protein